MTRAEIIALLERGIANEPYGLKPHELKRILAYLEGTRARSR